MSKVLIMSEQYQGGLACIQGLARAGHEIVLLAGKSPSPHASSRHVGKVIQPNLLLDSTAAKARSLKTIVAAESVDCVIPLSDDDALVVATAREAFPEMSAFVAPSVASVTIARDKIATLELAREIGLDVPDSIVISGKAELREASRGLGLPLVIKVPTSTASAGTFIVRNTQEIAARLPGLPSGRLLLQRFVPGDRVGATGFARNGVLLGWFGFRLPENIAAGGTPVYSFSDADLALGEMLATLARKLDWSGGMDVDAIRRESGSIALLEINPRFSGTLVFADKMGVHLPVCYPAAAAGVDASVAPQPARTTLYVSVVPDEVALISKSPQQGQKRAADLRAKYAWVDNLYRDDGDLCIAQMKRALDIAWRR